LFLWFLVVTELDILVDRRVNISLAVGMRLKTLLILPLLVASLQAASVADLTFNLNGDYTEYSVINCLETASGSLDIPSTYSGLPVTSIGSGTFSGCSSLSSITIPDSVTSIGSYAFDHCSSLTNITIPNSVTSIGDEAFYNCSSLTSITIPDGVTSIGPMAFDNCTSLTSIIIPDSVTSIESGAFQGCSSLTSIAIPNSVTSIESDAFQSCTSLSSITIPDNVTSIGDYTFNSCTSLTSITIPDGVTSIGSAAFRGCSGLTSITIPDSVTSIGEYAFQSCPNLTSVTFEGDAPTFGADVFYYSDSVTINYDSNYSGWSNNVAGRPAAQTNTFTFYPNGNGTEYTVTNCDPSASGSLDIPSTYNSLPVTSIGDYAFQSCTSLTSITIPDNVTSIGDYAFNSCTSLTSITIPDNVTSIGDYAFYGCVGLTSITFEGPPPAFQIGTLTSTGSEPILYYKAFPQMYSVYKETYNLPLVYLGPPTINVQPQGAIASIGEAVNLSVSATDVESSQLSYQWMRNGVDLAEETASALSITSITSTDGGSYQVKVSNTAGTTTSEAASLTLLASDLYTQQQFDTALSSGFALGVITVQENAANYGLVAEENIEDGRAGSSSIQVTNGTATLQLQIERSEDLNNWTSHQDDLISVPLQLNGDSQFFRFKMTEDIPTVVIGPSDPNVLIPEPDSDGDGFYDYEDAFPFDASEHNDSDGDGFGDNSDAFPYDSLEEVDSDGDGVGDNSDLYPFNPNFSQHTYNINGDLVVFSNTVANGASFSNTSLEFRNYEEEEVSLNSLDIDNCTIFFNGLWSQYRGEFKNSNITIGDGVALYGDLTNSTIHVIGDEVSTYANGYGDNVSVHLSSAFGGAQFNLTNSNVSAYIYGNYFSGTYEDSTVELRFNADDLGYLYDYNTVNATFINSTITGDFAEVKIEGDFRNSDLSGITNASLANWNGATLINTTLPSDLDPAWIESQGAIINSN